jgi:NADH-quinone oxidoreductase subunit N
MNLSLLVPEILVVLIACVLVFADLAIRDERTRANLGYWAVALLLLPFGATIALAGRVEESFYGTYVVDGMAVFFKLLFLVAAALTFMISTEYVRQRSIAAGEYYATILFATFGFMLMASARELITVYISLEMASIPLYMLVSMMKNDLRATEGGLKYLLLGALSSACLLYGMVLLYAATGTTILPDISRQIGSAGVLGIVAVVLVTAGFGFKIAAVPFHMWVPDVYQGAPTPTTAFLSVASKSAGFVLIFRFFSQGLGGLEQAWGPMMAVLAALTMTLGNVMALRQTNIKRLLGYSSIGQAGYAMMALAAPSPEVASGLMYFLLGYTVTNLGAFAGIITVSNQIGSDEIEDYRGLARRAGPLALLTTICFLSLVGMPPMAGFVGKFYLFLRVFEQGWVWLVIVGAVNTAIAVFYYLKVIRSMYFAAPASEELVIPTVGLKVALWTATAATIGVGLFASPLIRATQVAGRTLFP